MPNFCEKSGVLKKKGFRKFSARFLPFSKVKQKEGHGHGPFLTNQKKCCLRAEDRAFLRTCRLRGRGQGLQNVSSRTPPLRKALKLFEKTFFLFGLKYSKVKNYLGH